MASDSSRFDRLYGSLCTRLLLPVADRIAGQRIMPHYRFYAAAQWWDLDRLIEWQNAALAQTVRAAYHGTSLYRRLYDGAGVDPESVKSVADLARLPVLTKDLLREAYPGGCVISNGASYQELFTSGSTGMPLVVRVDRDTMSRARALMLLRANYSGWRIGEGMLQTGMSVQRGTLRALKDRWLRTSYVPAFDQSDRSLDAYLEIMDRKRRRYLMGYAASLYLLARRAAAVGFNRPLSGVVSWGDNMFPHYRRAIEEQFGCRVTDTYGCGEGLQIAAQCGQADGSYHLFMPHVAVEFVREGRPVPAGELGELLVTRLNAGAMPLIRYQVGDVGMADPRGSCPCGRGLALMKSIEGRSTDIVTTPGGNRLIVHFFTGIFEYARSIDTFQVVQEKADRITVKVVPKGSLDMDEWRRLESEILARSGGDFAIDLEVVDDIPLAQSNKRRFVISKMPL